MTLVDSNILIDIWTDDPDWYDWSVARLDEATRKGPLLINDIVYAETSIRFGNVEDFNAALAASNVNVLAMPRAALFLAGKTFTRYRNAGGPRTGVLAPTLWSRPAAADPRCGALSPLLSDGCIDRAVGLTTSGGHQ